jgi:DNA recombination protein RmuC
MLNALSNNLTLFLVLTLIAGVVLWVAWRTVSHSKAMAKAEADIALAREEAARVPVVDDRVESELRAQIQTLRGELAVSNEARMTAEKALSGADARVVSAERRIEDERANCASQMASLREENTRSITQMREAFGSMSADALAKMQPQFLSFAEAALAKHAEGAKGDLSNRQDAISAMLKPMEQMLATYQARLAQSESTQASAIGEVKKHLETLASQSQSLSGETLQLRRVLGSNQTRGRWGEETLRRVVEASGMSAHCDFTEQAQSDDKKPDMIIKMPGDRFIIIDSKVPDLDFLTALNEGDDEKRSASLKMHADKLRSTIKSLADRDYPSQFPNALDYVILFLPAESLFSAALEGDRDLIIWAAQRRIMLATPASLIALLRSVSVSWQQHDQAINAREIASSAEELFSRVATFVKHFDAIRVGLAKATDSYNDAVGSYERSVRPQGERIVKLGASSQGKVLAEPARISESLRLPPA